MTEYGRIVSVTMDRDSFIPFDPPTPDRPEFHNSCCGYEEDEIFNPDCAYCMRLWNEFIDKNNLYIATGKEKNE